MVGSAASRPVASTAVTVSHSPSPTGISTLFSVKRTSGASLSCDGSRAASAFMSCWTNPIRQAWSQAGTCPPRCPRPAPGPKAGAHVTPAGPRSTLKDNSRIIARIPYFTSFLLLPPREGSGAGVTCVVLLTLPSPPPLSAYAGGAINAHCPWRRRPGNPPLARAISSWWIAYGILGPEHVGEARHAFSRMMRGR